MNADSRRVLVLQHAEPEHLGTIRRVLDQQGVNATVVRADLGQPVPARLDGFSGLILMGGPQGVYEEDRFPFLKAEKSLTRHAVATEQPVLGICLGSEILAEALRSGVRPGRTFELGWKPVTTDPAATDDPVFSHLPGEFVPLHWHGDVYDLPRDSTPLGSSQLTGVQGFAYRQRAYGLLFHLEAELDEIRKMATAFPSDVRRGGSTASTLLSEAPKYLPAMHEVGSKVFREWASLL